MKCYFQFWTESNRQFSSRIATRVGQPTANKLSSSLLSWNFASKLFRTNVIPLRLVAIEPVFLRGAEQPFYFEHLAALKLPPYESVSVRVHQRICTWLAQLSKMLLTK